MKGIIILILILAALGIWWAKRDPEPIGGFQPEAVNAEDTNSIEFDSDGSDDPGEFEDKG